MPMHDWSRVQSGIYHNFHYRWIASIMDRLNGGLLPKGMIAMAEQIIGGPEPDVVRLQQNDIVFSANGGGVATMTEVLPKPKTEFVISVDVERYSTVASRSRAVMTCQASLKLCYLTGKPVRGAGSA